jgi:antitoxin (DNA-binding transcriptional repressor) of toxin-antitoxin stability system
MKVKRYTVIEAQRDFERLLLEAEQGVEVYIVDEGKQVVQLVPFERDKERMLGNQQQI